MELALQVLFLAGLDSFLYMDEVGRLVHSSTRLRGDPVLRWYAGRCQYYVGLFEVWWAEAERRIWWEHAREFLLED